MKKILSKEQTIAILFLEGFVSVSLQMLMMRQLVPFVGSSVVVSSLVVSVFLAALSLGYAFGGRTKKNHIKKLRRNLLISSILISVGLSYTFMGNWFVISNYLLNSPLFEVFIYLMLFLSPIVFLLGQTVPLLTNFYKANNVSETAGDTFAISTVGSVLGSIVTSLVFFYFFGMAKTVLISVLILGIVLMMLIENKKYIKNGIAYSVILTICYVLNVSYEKENLVLTNAYNNYNVINIEHGKMFVLNESAASAVFEDGTNWKYLNDIKSMMFHESELAMKDKDILILGAGGFTLSHGDNIPKNNFVYVDIDPAMKEVAEKHFLETKINGKFVAEDARVFVQKTEEKYDAILVDIFSNKTSVPWHLLTTEFFADVKSVTKKNGYVFFNVISSPTFSDKYSRNIYNTIHNTFDYCHSRPMKVWEGKTNIVYICKNIDDEDKTIYVDNVARSALDEIAQ